MSVAKRLKNVIISSPQPAFEPSLVHSFVPGIPQQVPWSIDFESLYEKVMKQLEFTVFLFGNAIAAQKEKSSQGNVFCAEFDFLYKTKDY